MPDLQITGLEVTGTDGRLLLAVPDLRIAAGTSVAILGPSGAGKSTLLHALSGLIPVKAGRVVWGDTDIARLTPAAAARFRAATIGLIFQDFLLFEELGSHANAAIAAAFAPAAARVALRARAADLLTGLGPATSRRVDSFSGGERQRISVARALAPDPQVILADEPTASLDRAAADRLIDDLAALPDTANRTLIAVTHDTALANRLHRRLTIRDGKITGDSDA